LVPDIPHAVRASRAFKVYVCNVATQPGETDGYDCGAHLRAIEEHVGSGLIDLVLANDVASPTLPPSVTPVTAESNGNRVPVHSTDLVDDVQPWRHDAAKLAETLIALLEERTGPLELPTLDEIEARPGLN
jgi:uncharacterized cofD-like protein